MNQINVCCADCGEEGGASLKACTACRLVKYCNAKCQRNHWPKHKKECKQRAAELRDEALFKDPPAKEDCPICFLPMPLNFIHCISLPPATILSVPIYDYAMANEELANPETRDYYECCGKSICNGCSESLALSGNMHTCPFCKAVRMGKTNEAIVEGLMKRIEVNDADAMFELAGHYKFGSLGLQQDQERVIELMTKAAELGHSHAHFFLGNTIHDEGGDLKKAKFHYETAVIAGHEGARHNLGLDEYNSGKKERARRHWKIAASAGEYHSMERLRKSYENGIVSRDEIDPILTAYNNSCAEMRSEARDAFIQWRADLAAERERESNQT
jgi:TPR repeat protein